MNYTYKRKEFYESISDFWPDLYELEYSLYHVFPVEEKLILEIRKATERIHQIFKKTAMIARHLTDSELVQLGYPEKTIPFLRIQSIYPDYVIGRLDFVAQENEIKLLEFNSDTPTFIKECFSINKLICDHFQVNNPNEKEEQKLKETIRQAIGSSYESLLINRPARVVFTAHQEDEEGWFTAKYIQALSGIESDLVPLEDLRINSDGLFTSDGLPVDILYRQTFPIEHLILDVDEETGDEIGVELLKLVQERKLAIINPPAAFLLQTKGLMALIWMLYENENPNFSKEELMWINQYFLPTYFDADAFIGKERYVKKPCFGREGDSVQVFSPDQKELICSNQSNYLDELPIYQKFIELPKARLETEKGIETLSYMFGCFLLAGLPSAIGIRCGAQITGNESYFLPVCMKKEPQ